MLGLAMAFVLALPIKTKFFSSCMHYLKFSCNALSQGKRWHLAEKIIFSFDTLSCATDVSIQFSNSLILFRTPSLILDTWVWC